MDLGAGVAPPSPAPPGKRLDAIKLAKSSKWDELKRLVDAEPPTAQQTDSYGMLPLHWACTEPHSIGEGVLMALLKAFPAGARVANTAEMLPLQIAIKAQAKIEWLQALLASFPDAVLKKTPTGEHAVELARKAGLPPRSIRLLEEMYLHVCQKAGYASDHLYEDDNGATNNGNGNGNGHGNSNMVYRGSGGSGGERDDAPYATHQAQRTTTNTIISNSRGTHAARRPSHPDTYRSRTFSDHDFQQQQTMDAIAMAYRSTGEMPLNYMRAASTSSNGSGSGGGTMGMNAAPPPPAPGGGGGGGGSPGQAKPLPYQVSTKLSSRTVVSLPPRWMNAPNCHICSQKWSTFRKRHHCRNCGQSICGDHSARERMRLPHYGLPDRYRVCTVCHHTLRTAAAEMLQPSHVGRMPTPNTAQRRSDERLSNYNGSLLYASNSISGGSISGGGGSMSGGGNSFQLERHVSAPARPMMDHQDYHGIQDQVASLQMQVSQLLEQKEIAESQLRAQAELLADPYPQPTRGTNYAHHVGRRERLNSTPIKLPSTGPGSYPGSSRLSGGQASSYGSYDMNGRLTRSTESSDTREVDMDYGGALSMSSAVPEPPTSNESGLSASGDAMARLQDDLGSMSFVSSYSEFDDRSTTGVYDDGDPTASGYSAHSHQDVLEEGHEDDEMEEDDDDDDDDDVGDSTLPEVEVLVNLGFSMLNKGSSSAAVQAFARAVEICPDTAVLYGYLAKAQYADDNLDEAVVALTTSLELEPSAAHWTLLGKILFEKGDHERAIEAYQKSLEYQTTSSS